MAETVDVLLATFNGARFLGEQLGSLERQTYADWRLIVRDDGSTDGSSPITEDFARRHPDKVQVLRDERGRLGPCGNFAALLEASDAPYFMFCDQDDVWLPDKIAGLLGALRRIEERRGVATPILAHSDLVVVDDELRVLHHSFWRYSRLLDPRARRRPARLIIQNYVTGCASIGNAALRRAALPIPAEARVHDWWVAMVAAALGEISEHEVATILYRQHDDNQFGARPTGVLIVASRLIHTRGATMQDMRLALTKSQEQAAAFRDAYERVLSADMTRIVSEFSCLCASSLWKRKSFLFRHHLWPDYWLDAATFLGLL